MVVSSPTSPSLGCVRSGSFLGLLNEGRVCDFFSDVTVTTAAMDTNNNNNNNPGKYVPYSAPHAYIRADKSDAVRVRYIYFDF